MRSKSRRAAVYAGLVVMLLAPSDAHSRQNHDPAGSQKASAFLERLRQRLNIAGMSSAVAVDGRIIWSAGFGWADIEDHVPANPATVYRVGSVSKVFTTGAIARLMEENRLDIDADVRRYVPEFPDKGATITTRMLSGHLGGIRHYRRGESSISREGYTNVIEALELFAEDPLRHPPGSRWAYSSYGWILISAVIQRAAGKPFLEYMRGAVFEPLSMRRTKTAGQALELEGLARLYDGGKAVERNDISYIWAGGGFLSTAEDLVRFGSAFLPGAAFISDQTLQVLVTNQVTSGGEEVPHAIGWMADRRPSGEQVWYHGGTILGGHSVLYVEPANRIVVAMVANESSGFGLTEAYIVASHFLGRTEPPQFVRESPSLKLRRGNRERLLAAFEAWKEALTNGDADAAMEFVAEDFGSARWADKQALRSSLEAWISKGAIRVGGEVHIGIRGVRPGSTSDISSLKLTAEDTVVELTVIFTLQKDGSWLITTMI